VDKNQYRYIKRLLAALAISGFANIVIVSIWVYSAFKDPSPTHYHERRPVPNNNSPLTLVDQSNGAVLRKFRSLSTHQLNMRLYSRKLLENGYTERDLALACLVTLHHFDLKRALVEFRDPQQTRTIAYGRRKDGSIATITVYPELQNAHFESIIRFAKTERWPYTPEGLFLLLQASQEHKDPSLLEAFMLTPEFMAFESLFNRSQAPITKEDIVSLLLDGNWQPIKQFRDLQRLSQDFSAEMRQKILLQFIERGSPVACELLLKCDFSFALRKLENQHISKMLQLLDSHSSAAKAFAAALMQSPRGDAIWQLAAQRLGDMLPQPPNATTLAIKTNTDPYPSSVVPSGPKISKADKLYIIQEGDSLWKLSRRFGVSIASLKAHNQLHSDSLKPGSPLRIPIE
jgi:LysM repeat protein